MLILTLRTDKPEAEIGLYNDEQQLSYLTWQAHRLLAETIHIMLKDLLTDQKRQLEDIEGIVVFKGPGSFTGLRIGISAANALADSLTTSIIGATSDNWLEKGLQEITKGQNNGIVLPEYGSPPHVTVPKH